MNSDALFIIGGVGLFLLGMALLTDGLKGLAGNSLRRLITRFTRSPLSGAATGAVSTAILQSSSATTVATVGFVSAGLLTFPMALGVIFGANIGTTITGWLVALVGFKFHLDAALMPFILVGVLMKMFGSGRWPHLGYALAGFALLFIGINAMQEGMAALEGQVTPDSFPQDTLFGRVQLILIGVVVTVITQSSSAALVAALVAVEAGTITFAQAAAMVIGMNIGTTCTAALASIGGSVATRRTGAAHVIFNLLTAIIAFFLLPLYIQTIQPMVIDAGAGPQIALAAFHTAFNILGVLTFIWFTNNFARLVVRLVPETGPPLTSQLDNRLLKHPSAATDATIASLSAIATSLFSILATMLTPSSHRHLTRNRLKPIAEALQTVDFFIQQIRTDPSAYAANQRHIASLHALDHLWRLYNRCITIERIETLQQEPHLRQLGNELHRALQIGLGPEHIEEAEKQFNTLRHALRSERDTYREDTISAATQGKFAADMALDRMDSIRWLHRTTYHLWRIAHHLRAAITDAGQTTAAEAAEKGDQPGEEEVQEQTDTKDRENPVQISASSNGIQDPDPSPSDTVASRDAPAQPRLDNPT